RLLAGDRAQLVDRAIHQLGVLGSFSQPDVDRDLLELRHRHRVGVGELLRQPRNHFLLIMLSQTRCHRILVPSSRLLLSYFLSTPVPHLRQTRTRRLLPPATTST